jgi:hypothetical protein
MNPSLLVRTVIGVGLVALVFGQMGISPVALLVIAFLITVVCTPLTRKKVF